MCNERRGAAGFRRAQGCRSSLLSVWGAGSSGLCVYYTLCRHGQPYGVALVTDLSQPRGYCARMAPEDIQHLIDRAIRDHEMRVALWSGLLGALLMAGTWHAIWLCR
jgi:hypothetical protein